MSEPELAQRYAQAVEQLYPLVDPLVSNSSPCTCAMRRRAR